MLRSIVRSPLLALGLGTVVAVVVAAAACSIRSAADEPDAGAESAAVAPQSREACEARGGEWARFGLLGVEKCNLPSADAGQACRNHADCASICVAAGDVPAGTPTQGRCYERTITLGTCLNYVVDGVARGIICVD